MWGNQWRLLPGVCWSGGLLGVGEPERLWLPVSPLLALRVVVLGVAHVMAAVVPVLLVVAGHSLSPHLTGIQSPVIPSSSRRRRRLNRWLYKM